MQRSLHKLPVACPVVILLLVRALAHAETGVQAWVQRYNGQACALAVDGSNNVIVTGYSMGNGSYNDFATVKYSSAGLPLWTNRYNSPVNGSDLAAAVAVDGSNNVIVTGSSDNGGETSVDYATIKYSSAGEPLWTNRYCEPLLGADRPWAVAVDGSNNVIVTGSSSGGIDTGFDYATIKYSSDGEPLWTNRYTRVGNYGDNAVALAVDRNNDVIVTGSSFSSPSMNSDYATIKYSSEGLPLWTNLYNGLVGGPDMAKAVAVDGHNNVVVTGGSAGGGSGFDYATIKYSSAGEPLWTNRYANGSACALAVDGSDDVIVAGASSGGASSGDYTMIKYSGAGLPLWTNRYDGPASGSDSPCAVAVDGSNNVIVTGYSASTNAYPYNDDYATIKYSAAGVPLWTNLYAGPGNGDDEPVALALDRCNNVIVTGFATVSGGSFDFATIKYICVPSPLLTALQPTTGPFQLRVDGVLQPGTLVVEAATNMAAWTPVFTNTTPTNVLFYTDPGASNTPTRFYRAYQFP